ncbi:MAG: hypothetical protein PHO12_10205 [Bacteroidales bacterium]|nr:hypothetical protein [Bacteroidales bacterium]
MKKLIFTIFLLSSFLVYSQEEMPIKQPSKFHHSIGLNLSPLMLGGYIVPDIFQTYTVPFGGKHWRNFIPYYELDYNNKIFLAFNYRYDNIDYKFNAGMYNLLLSYNFFKSKSSQAFKLGAGGVYFRAEKNRIVSYRIGHVLALTYHEKNNKHLGAGIGIDLAFFPSTIKKEDYGDIIVESRESAHGIFHFYLKFSYTF